MAKIIRPASKKSPLHSGGGRKAVQSPDLEEIGERMRRLRASLARDVTDKAFAGDLGVSLSTAQSWLKGNGDNKVPDLPALIAIARKHRVNLNWLLLGEGDPKRRIKRPSKQSGTASLNS